MSTAAGHPDARAIASGPGGSNPDRPLAALGIPAAGWVLLFVLVPVCLVAVYAFFGAQRNLLGPFTLDNVVAVLGSESLRNLLLRTFLMACGVTALAVIIGLPIAYYVVRRARYPQLILSVLLLPYLVGYVPRILSIRLSLGSSGLAGSLVAWLGLPREIVSPLLFSHAGTVIGLLYSQLPVMVVLGCLAFERIDQRLFEVAADLGAGSYRIFFSIGVPNALPGIAAGAVLVFAAVLGAYVEPALMGGANGRLAANIIAQRFIQFYDWGRGSALALAAIVMILLICMAVFLLVKLFRSQQNARQAPGH